MVLDHRTTVVGQRGDVEEVIDPAHFRQQVVVVGLELERAELPLRLRFAFHLVQELVPGRDRLRIVQVVGEGFQEGRHAVTQRSGADLAVLIEAGARERFRPAGEQEQPVLQFLTVHVAHRNLLQRGGDLFFHTLFLLASKLAVMFKFFWVMEDSITRSRRRFCGRGCGCCRRRWASRFRRVRTRRDRWTARRRSRRRRTRAWCRWWWPR